MTELRITEIFYSLQGETNTVGIPTVFIRLTGCPLRCVYCDSSYAFTGGKKMTIADIINEVGQYHCQYITVTGGEPLAQAGCLELMKQLADLGYNLSLETSGALDVSKVDKRVVKVIDLKTPDSGEETKNRYQNLNHITVKDQLKFVISSDHDYQWSKNIIEQHQLLGRCEILFSPVAGQQSPTELAEKILADRLPVRFQIQLHKLLWGDVQGK